MSQLIASAACITLVATMILSVLTLVSMGCWHIIYHVFRCRRAPIQKAVITAASVIWIISGAVISLL